MGRRNDEQLEDLRRSEDEPFIISSYGDSTERPRFEVSGTWLITHGGGGASEQRSHVRIVGLHVFMYSKAPDDPRFTGQGSSCIQWLRDGGDVLIEDMRCDYAQLNLQSEPDATLHRAPQHPVQELLAQQPRPEHVTSIAAPLTVEENVMNQGGWNEVFRLALVGVRIGSDRVVGDQ